MNDTVKIQFLTSGFGGNEIAALEIRKILIASKASVEIEVANRNPSLTKYLADKSLDFTETKPKAIPSHRTIHVASSYLSAIRMLPLSALRSSKSYIYTPFWGFEWTKSGVSQSARIMLCRFSVAVLDVEQRIIAPFDSFRSRVFRDQQLSKWVFPNVSDTEGIRAETPSLTHDNPIYVIGRIDFRQKGQDILLKHYQSLIKRRHIFPELHFIGDGPDTARLRSSAQSSTHVHFHGWAERPISIPSNGVIALSSWFEGLPLVVLEAVGANLPAIASRTSGADQILPTQCIYDMHDPISFESAYQYAVNNRDSVIQHSASIISKRYVRSRLREACEQWLDESAER